MKIVSEQEAYENLANAIIRDAVKMYKRALIRMYRHPESEAAKKEAEAQEQFFFSDWYGMLTNLDGGYLVRKLKETIREKYDNPGGI